MIKTTGSTPRGTAPQPTRRTTRQRQATYGLVLKAKANKRREKRAKDQAELKAIAARASGQTEEEKKLLKEKLGKRPMRPAKSTQGHVRNGTTW